MPRLSGAMQRWRRPNAPRCSAQPAVIDAEALDHQDRRAVAATPRAVRDVRAVVGDRRRHDARLPAGLELGVEQSAPTARAHRLGEAGGRERIVGVVRIGQRDQRTEASRPTSRSTAAEAADRRAPRRERSARASSAWRHGVRRVARAGAQPGRRERDPDEMAGAQRGARRRARCSRSRRGGASTVPRTGTSGAPTTRSRRPLARCTATPSAAGSATPKPRFETITAGPVAGTCSPPLDVARAPRRRTAGARDRRAADRARTGRRDSGPTTRRGAARCQRAARATDDRGRRRATLGASLPACSPAPRDRRRRRPTRTARAARPASGARSVEPELVARAARRRRCNRDG